MARSPASLEVNAVSARRVTLGFTPFGLHVRGGITGQTGTFRIAINAGPAQAVSVEVDEQSTVALDLPTGRSTITIASDAGNVYYPNGDPRFSSFGLNGITVTTAGGSPAIPMPLAKSGGHWLRLHECNEGGPARRGERHVIEPRGDADEVDRRRCQDVLQMRLRRADVFRTAQAEGAHPLRDRPLDPCAPRILRCERRRFLLGAPRL